MNDQEVRRYQMFTRVRDFGTTNTASFQSSSMAGELFATVNSVVNELSGHAATKFSANNTLRQGTTTKAILRNELREDLIAISRTARAISVIKPGFEDKFRLPPNKNDQLLISAAKAFASDAAPFISDFISREMPGDFLDELNATIKLFEKVVVDKNMGAEARLSARAAIDEAIDRGMDAVRQLDAIVKNKFSNDPVKLSAWASAKHIERAPRSAVVEDDSQPATSSN
jgi:hypothetical protein